MAPEKQTILFVDDEDYLVEIGKEVLEDDGHTVDITTSPEDALAIMERWPDRYDILITDYTMPGMNGDQLAAAVHEFNPDLPVILCSGTHLPPGIEEHVARVLLKPFDMELMLAAVRQISGAM